MFPVLTFGYDNKKTHPDILTLGAVNKTGENNFSGLLIEQGGISYREVAEYSIKNNRSNDIREGSIEEDNFAGFFFPRPANHFYNPYTGQGIFGFQSAFEYSIKLWGEAMAFYYQGNKENAYYTLGRAIHLLEDMGSAPHTHADIHLALVPQKNSFEEWVLNESQHNADYYFNSDIVPTYIAGGPTSLEGFIHQHALFTNNSVRIEGKLNRDEDHPVDGNLGRMFPEMAYLNYIAPVPDGDGKFTQEYWSIKNVGKCYSGPNGGAVANDDWWRAEPKNGGEYYYIESVKGVYPAEYPTRPNGTEWVSTRKELPRIWIEDYGLIKQTVNRVAGALKLFYDIVNEPPYIKDITVTDSNKNTVYQTVLAPGGDGRHIEVLTAPQKLALDEVYTVNVTFSEQVKDVNFSLGRDDVIVDAPVASNTDGTWEGTFVIPEPLPEFGSPPCDTKIALTINAADLNNHLDVPDASGISFGAPLDQNPETIATRGTAEPYPWSGYETAVEVASFPPPCDCENDRVNPIVRLDPLRECFTSNSIEISGRATDSCKLESVTVDNVPAVVGKDGAFSATVTLSDGSHTVMVEAKDANRNTAHESVSFRVDTQPPQLVSLSPTQGEKDVRLTAPVIAEYDEELSAGEIIMTNASGRSVRQGRRIVYEHLPFQSDQSYTLQIVGVRDTCGCTIK
jgi:hypothetical protein